MHCMVVMSRHFKPRPFRTVCYILHSILISVSASSGVANEDSDEMDHTLDPWKHAYGTDIVFLWRDQVCDESS